MKKKLGKKITAKKNNGFFIFLPNNCICGNPTHDIGNTV